MSNNNTNKSFSKYSLNQAQIAWVVRDIEKSILYFQEMLGVKFSPVSISKLSEYDGTYYGELQDAENYISMAYSGGIFIELIQPLFGQSIFSDYWNSNTNDGIHHIA